MREGLNNGRAWSMLPAGYCASAHFHILLNLRQHDNHGWLVVPNHLPEVRDSAWSGTLGQRRETDAYFILPFNVNSRSCPVRVHVQWKGGGGAGARLNVRLVVCMSAYMSMLSCVS